MHGKTHAVHGAIAGTAVAMLATNATLGLLCVPLAALAALGPDVDHHASSAGRLLPPVRWTMRGLSRALGLPAHRGITHTVLLAVVLGAATLPVLPWVLSLAVTAGWLAALAGDWSTKTSLPYLWWPFAVTEKVSHKGLRITTGKGVERWLIYPLSLLILMFGAWLAFLR
jgi:membrane-bound metal-dependent hydrolase YbcI (DUF457 family)